MAAKSGEASRAEEEAAAQQAQRETERAAAEARLQSLGSELAALREKQGQLEARAGSASQVGKGLAAAGWLRACLGILPPHFLARLCTCRWPRADGPTPLAALGFCQPGCCCALI